MASVQSLRPSSRRGPSTRDPSRLNIPSSTPSPTKSRDALQPSPPRNLRTRLSNLTNLLIVPRDTAKEDNTHSRSPASTSSGSSISSSTKSRPSTSSGVLRLPSFMSNTSSTFSSHGTLSPTIRLTGRHASPPNIRSRASGNGQSGRPSTASPATGISRPTPGTSDPQISAPRPRGSLRPATSAGLPSRSSFIPRPHTGSSGRPSTGTALRSSPRLTPPSTRSLTSTQRPSTSGSAGAFAAPRPIPLQTRSSQNELQRYDTAWSSDPRTQVGLPIPPRSSNRLRRPATSEAFSTSHPDQAAPAYTPSSTLTLDIQGSMSVRREVFTSPMSRREVITLLNGTFMEPFRDDLNEYLPSYQKSIRRIPSPRIDDDDSASFYLTRQVSVRPFRDDGELQTNNDGVHDRFWQDVATHGLTMVIYGSKESLMIGYGPCSTPPTSQERQHRVTWGENVSIFVSGMEVSFPSLTVIRSQDIITNPRSNHDPTPASAFASVRDSLHVAPPFSSHQHHRTPSRHRRPTTAPSHHQHLFMNDLTVVIDREIRDPSGRVEPIPTYIPSPPLRSGGGETITSAPAYPVYPRRPRSSGLGAGESAAQTANEVEDGSSGTAGGISLQTSHEFIVPRSSTFGNLESEMGELKLEG